MSSVEDLEKKYFVNIENIILSNEFLEDLKEIESFIQRNYEFLSEHWQEKNKLKIAVERILRYYFYTKIQPLATYNSVLSSDVAFYTREVLLNIDAKTTDISSSGNEADFYYPAILGRNQITFKNKNLFENTELSINKTWNGVPFPPLLVSYSQHPITKKKVPTLTYFVKFAYFDDGISFRIDRYALSCIPHSSLSARFNNDIIQNFKSYFYDRKIQALEDNEIESKNWHKKQITTKTFYFNPNTLEAWGKEGGKWKKVISGGTARIKKENQFDKNSNETIERRKDSKDEIWKGFKTYSYGNSSKQTKIDEF